MPERILPGREASIPDRADWGRPLSEDLRRLDLGAGKGSVAEHNTASGRCGGRYLHRAAWGCGELERPRDRGRTVRIRGLGLLTPQPGWRAFVADEGSFAWFDGTA
jgi:hypothetical protein